MGDRKEVEVVRQEKRVSWGRRRKDTKGDR